MNNLSINQGVYTFATNGGDSRTMRQAVLVVLGTPILYVAAVLVFRWALPEIMTSGAETLLLNPFLILALSLGIVAITFMRLNKGSAARFAVEIDPTKKVIRARDRVQGVQMWEDLYEPEKLFIARIQVIVQGEPYLYPTLVYGDPNRDPAFRFVSNSSDVLDEESQLQSAVGPVKSPLVEESVPYNDRAVLGYGEMSELQKVMRQLGAEQ